MLNDRLKCHPEPAVAGGICFFQEAQHGIFTARNLSHIVLTEKANSD
jgi:hypothetical protein